MNSPHFRHSLLAMLALICLAPHLSAQERRTSDNSKDAGSSASKVKDTATTKSKPDAAPTNRNSSSRTKTPEVSRDSPASFRKPKEAVFGHFKSIWDTLGATTTERKQFEDVTHAFLTDLAAKDYKACSRRIGPDGEDQDFSVIHEAVFFRTIKFLYGDDGWLADKNQFSRVYTFMPFDSADPPAPTGPLRFIVTHPGAVSAVNPLGIIAAKKTKAKTQLEVADALIALKKECVVDMKALVDGYKATDATTSDEVLKSTPRVFHHHCAGLLLLSLGQNDSAAKVLTEAIARGKFMLPYAHRGDAYARIGEHSKAAADYTRVINGTKKTVPTLFIARAKARFELKSYDRAAEDLRVALKETPNDRDVWFNLAECLGKLNKHDECAAALTQAIKLVKPDQKGVLSRLLQERGNAYSRLKDSNREIADRKAAAEAAVDNDVLWAELGGAYHNANQVPEAVSALTTAISLTSSEKTARGRYFFQRALCHLKSEKYELVLADANSAVACGVDDRKEPIAKILEISHFRIGRAHYDSKEWGKAIESFTSCIKYGTNDANTYVWRGSAYSEDGQDAKAVADFRAALKGGAIIDSAGVWLHYAHDAHRLGHLEEAETAATKLIELEIKEKKKGKYYAILGMYYDLRSQIREDRGEFAGAISDLDKMMDVGRSVMDEGRIAELQRVVKERKKYILEKENNK